MSEIYALLTLQLHLPPDYVLDKMELFEIKAILKYQYYANKESWEQARLIAYIVAQSNSTKKLKLTDIIKFAWETDIESDTAVSNEEKLALQERAKLMEEQMNKNIQENING